MPVIQEGKGAQENFSYGPAVNSLSVVGESLGLVKTVWLCLLSSPIRLEVRRGWEEKCYVCPKEQLLLLRKGILTVYYFSFGLVLRPDAQSCLAEKPV
ncbi:hypothetical protein GRJ2_002058600 [Grus japonensis]|uniref:Uncharacterized protein n=1 Tax=Grus japonensis TaxID=30415 RepID=A0ABC9XE62_GRUJA